MNTGTKRKIAALCAMFFWLMVLGGAVFGLAAWAEEAPQAYMLSHYERGCLKTRQPLHKMNAVGADGPGRLLL